MTEVTNVTHNVSNALDLAGLVLMPDIEPLDSDQRKAVASARWWEADGKVLVVSAAEMQKVGINAEDDPADAGIDIHQVKLEEVADGLKRWSEEDGFYHA